MKKRIALILLLLTVFAMLTGCSAEAEQEKLVGTWKGQLDMADTLEGLELGDFTVTVVYTFRADGTYTKELERTSVETAFAGLLEQMQAALTEQNAGTAVDPESILEAAGIRLEERVDALLESSKTEGKFRAGSGKLHLTETPEQEINDRIYDTYTLNGDVLTLTAAYGVDQDGQNLLNAVYPVILKKD